ncbi:MAG: PP2C family protein-serine/threonine phosphatase [Terriglobia bacterium]
MIENTAGVFPARQVPSTSGQRAAEASMLEVDFSEQSDVGKVRDRNEDSHGYVAPANLAQARSQGWLFVLADGVGGHERGEVASRLAVDCLLEGFRESAAGEPHTTLLPRLAEKANLRVYEAGRAAAPGGARMATTLVACALRYDRAVIAHVGDSRCYLIRRGRATPLTRDHTVANEHLRMGLISAGESAQSANRFLLLRSLGNDLFVNVDVNETQVVPGDVLLQCCDGLHGAVEAADMARIVTQNRDLREAAQQLVALANERDGSDNISVQLVRIRGVERVGMYRGRPYKLR